MEGGEGGDCGEKAGVVDGRDRVLLEGYCEVFKTLACGEDVDEEGAVLFLILGWTRLSQVDVEGAEMGGAHGWIR